MSNFASASDLRAQKAKQNKKSLLTKNLPVKKNEYKFLS